jgi:hypothetical protein
VLEAVKGLPSQRKALRDGSGTVAMPSVCRILYIQWLLVLCLNGQMAAEVASLSRATPTPLACLIGFAGQWGKLGSSPRANRGPGVRLHSPRRAPRRCAQSRSTPAYEQHIAHRTSLGPQEGKGDQ